MTKSQVQPRERRGAWPRRVLLNWYVETTIHPSCINGEPHWSVGFCDYGGDNNTSAVRRKRLAMRRYCLFRDTLASRRTWRGGRGNMRETGIYNVPLTVCGTRRSPVFVRLNQNKNPAFRRGSYFGGDNKTRKERSDGIARSRQLICVRSSRRTAERVSCDEVASSAAGAARGMAPQSLVELVCGNNNTSVVYKWRTPLVSGVL